MPVFDYECPNCGTEKTSWERVEICDCGSKMRKLPPVVRAIISGNPGPKIKTRVNLDDELRREGFSAPLFKSEETKDQARWMLKKVGVK